MDILENRDEWAMQYQSGWLAHHQATGEFDWVHYPYARNKTPIRGPGIDLSQSRLALISTAGGYLPESQDPFDATNPYGDYSIRLFPATTGLDMIDYAHTHYDHAAATQDPQVLIPLRHLDWMVADGIIGELAPSVVSFMGYQPDLARVVDELFPAILEVLRVDKVDAALLVPA